MRVFYPAGKSGNQRNLGNVAANPTRYADVITQRRFRRVVGVTILASLQRLIDLRPAGVKTQRGAIAAGLAAAGFQPAPGKAEARVLVNVLRQLDPAVTLSLGGVIIRLTGPPRGSG